jgi:two-component system response regulator HydG
MTHPILVVDDDASMCELLSDGLDRYGFQVERTTRPELAEALVAEKHFEAVLTDVRMRGVDGLELCSRLCELKRDLPVIVMTAFGSFETAVQALRSGAYDFLTKPLDVEVAAHALHRALNHGALRREVAELKRAVAATQAFGELLGASPAMQAVYDLVERAAPSEASVLLTGESGTGKELLARTLHEQSARGKGPFVSINCAALPETLLESELFGHTKGAFTDARSARDGLLVKASGGTLFLDEIGEMPAGLQPKLLRALQSRSIRPVGSDREVPVDLRLISATNRDLERAIEERSFREDLYYRINVIHIALPALRARGTDVLLLARHFLSHFAERARRPLTGLSVEAERLLVEYPWPGNVRELSNCMERAVVLSRKNELDVDDLPEKVRDYAPPSSQGSKVEEAHDLARLDEIERRHILKVMEAVRGNKSQAAQILGLDRKTLYRRLEQYGVE